MQRELYPPIAAGALPPGGGADKILSLAVRLCGAGKPCPRAGLEGPMDHEVYDNPLVTRYAGAAMCRLWSPQRKFSTWRRLWLALAEAQHELGLTAADGASPRITAAQLAELRAHLDDIDFAAAERYE